MEESTTCRWQLERKEIGVARIAGVNIPTAKRVLSR